MSSTAAASGDGDEQLDPVDRIVRSWRELRRGAAAQTLREQLLGIEGIALEQAQLDALEILADEPVGLRMSAVADALRIDPSSATRALARLERLGLAERSTADGDRRVVIARPTEAGRRLLDRISTLRRSGVEEILATFDEKDRAALADQLDRFVDAIDRRVDELLGRSSGPLPPT